MKKTPQNYPLFDMIYGSSIPYDQFFVHEFETIPSKMVLKQKFTIDVIDVFLINGFEAVSKFSTIREGYTTITQMMVNFSKKCVGILNMSNIKSNNTIDIELVYDITYEGYLNDSILSNIKNFELPRKKSSIHIVKSSFGSLETDEYDLIVPDIDLELNYGEKFVNTHSTIIDRLNNNHDKGIVLLHGDPGTGKTTYLKYLTKLITNKDILFIPPSMAEVLSDPQIIPFLIDNKNSILLIEDAEKVISDRETNQSSAGVSNLLNLTDGILSDCLNIQVIATFNMKRERIDQALLRKGRLICEHRFDKLSVDETNRLLTHLNKNIVVDKSLTLADIYNIDIDEIRSSTNKKIGF